MIPSYYDALDLLKGSVRGDDPRKLLRALLLQMRYSIRSERLLMKERAVRYRYAISVQPTARR